MWIITREINPVAIKLSFKCAGAFKKKGLMEDFSFF
jgi:hypothetical protein